VTLSGGGFGRRSLTDYVQEAVFLSKAVGAPVQVIWMRADDIRYDYFHPKSLSAMRAQLDGEGLPTSWRHLVVGQPITSAGFDPLSQATGGSGYNLGSARVVTRTLRDVGVPTGIWRSVYNVNNTFATESFLDEIAAAGGRDPYELRRTLIRSDKQRAVLNRVAEMAGWGSPLPEGWGRGIAFHNTWGMTDVALVVEVSITDGEIRVQKVYCAVNCGIAIHPDMVKAQMEGGIVMGLTAALKEEITFENGLAEQSNFSSYPLLQMGETPPIEVEIMPSTDAPGGVGEMSISLVAPALANAIYSATGKRLRRFPFRREDLL
jgi:isoquinoline 1-oxidoreductase beta subunit